LLGVRCLHCARSFPPSPGSLPPARLARMPTNRILDRLSVTKLMPKAARCKIHTRMYVEGFYEIG
jgi:hypothetical protein